jgi:lycopene cyclase domain-containing protein
VPEYTVLTAVAVVVVLALDLWLLRTRLVRTGTFWISLAIMWSFQVFVDGWLTKLSSPIVRYDPDHASGVRVFFDSPIEDFGFGFALILLTLAVWDALGRRARPRRPAGSREGHEPATERPPARVAP